jgi:hypothetical protein
MERVGAGSPRMESKKAMEPKASTAINIKKSADATNSIMLYSFGVGIQMTGAAPFTRAILKSTVFPVWLLGIKEFKVSETIRRREDVPGGCT